MKRLLHIIGNKLLLIEIQFLKFAMTILTRITHSALTSYFNQKHFLFQFYNYDELSSVIVTLMRRFIKPEINGLKKGAFVYDIHIHVSDFKTHLAKADRDIEPSFVQWKYQST